uniref:Uncharacterized protein n=1 Tax=Glossina pallidipes TaxID=7398 RepID=A0A1A9ZRB1_GLOPL
MKTEGNNKKGRKKRRKSAEREGKRKGERKDKRKVEGEAMANIFKGHLVFNILPDESPPIRHNT